MPDVLRYRKSILSGVEETTAGTVGTVTAAMAATTVYNASIDEDLEVVERGPELARESSIQSLIGLNGATVSFSTEVAEGDCSAELLTACGFKLTGGVYKPGWDFTDVKNWSFAHFTDGNKKIAYGTALDLVADFEVGKYVMFNFNGRGIWGGSSAVALPSNPTISASPLKCTGMTLTLSGTAIAKPSRVSIRLNNQVVMRGNMANTAPDTTGIAHHYIAGPPRYTIEMDPETQLVGTLDNYALKAAGTMVAFQAICRSGSTTKLTVDAPQVQRVGIRQMERNGLRTDQLTLACRESAGGDELAFTFAAGW